MVDKDWIEFNFKIVSIVHLCYKDEILCKVLSYDSEIHLEGGGWIGVIANLMIFLNLSKYEWCNDLSKYD